MTLVPDRFRDTSGDLTILGSREADTEKATVSTPPAEEDAEEEKKSEGLEAAVNDVFGSVNGALASIMFYPVGGVVPLAVLWLVVGAIIFTLRCG